MVTSKRPSLLTATIVVLSLIAVALHQSPAIGQPADRIPPAPQGFQPAESDPFWGPILKSTSPAKWRTEHDALAREVLLAAYGAYEQSLADYRAGKTTDPEVVYRWSIRTMQAESAIQPASVKLADQKVASTGNHLRRMMQLADLTRERSATEGSDKSTAEMQRLATNYYRQEAQLLAEEAMAGSDIHRFKWQTTDAMASDTWQAAPKKESPKETKVFILEHAEANQLLQTINELLGNAGPDLRMAADVRTNRVLVHGVNDKVKQVEELIRELDTPSKRNATSFETGRSSNAAKKNELIPGPP